MENPLDDDLLLSRLWIPGLWHGNAEREDMIGAKPEMDIEQALEAAQRKQRTGQQNHAQSDLDADEQVSDLQTGCGVPWAARRTFFEPGSQILARGPCPAHEVNRQIK